MHYAIVKERVTSRHKAGLPKSSYAHVIYNINISAYVCGRDRIYKLSREFLRPLELVAKLLNLKDSIDL